jgi:hypothetical protein
MASILKRLFLLVFAVVGVGYSVLSIQFMFGLAAGGSEGTWYEQLESYLTRDNNPAYSYGEMSKRSHKHLLQHLLQMQLHTVCAGLALIVQIWQVLSKSNNWPGAQYHKETGWLIMLLMIGQLIGIGGFLYETPQDDFFGGQYAPTFQMVLTVLWVLTIQSSVKLWTAARDLDMERHVLFALLNHGNMWSAPLLRICWITLPNLYPNVIKGPVNALSVIIAAGILNFVAIVYSIHRRANKPLSKGQEPFVIQRSNWSKAGITLFFTAIFMAGCLTSASPNLVLPYSKDTPMEQFAVLFTLSAGANVAVTFIAYMQPSIKSMYLTLFSSTCSLIAAVAWYSSCPPLGESFGASIVEMNAVLSSFSALLCVGCQLRLVYSRSVATVASQLAITELAGLCCGAAVSHFFGLFVTTLVGDYYDDQNVLTVSFTYALSVTWGVVVMGIEHSLPRATDLNTTLAAAAGGKLKAN